MRRIVDGGQLVGDEVVEEIIRSRLAEHDWNFGFILDGFPRNATQTEFFLETYDIDAVIHLVIPDEVVRDRVLSRRLCSHCGLDFNLIFHRPAVEETCDVCGGALVSRTDDTESALASRLQNYHSKTKPMLERFRRKALIFEIDGTGTKEVIQDQIREHLSLPKHQAESA